MPTLKFTARGIASLKAPSDGRVDYWDTTLRGFGLRVSSTGVKSWVTMYRHKGRLRRHTLGTFPIMSLADAYERARESLSLAANGGDPAEGKRWERVAETFGELAQEYLSKHADKKKKRPELDRRMIDAELNPRWKHRKAKDIQRRDVLDVLDEIMSRGAPIQANRVLALIRKMFNFAIARDIVEHNPCAAITSPGKAQSRDRVLNAEEIRKVWQAAENEGGAIAAILKLRLLTAQRGGEIESMSWSDIDLVGAMWTIPAERSKNGLAHRVPLSPPVLSVLKALWKAREGSPWVFPSPLGSDQHIENVQKALQRVRARPECGVDFVGHDLRRTAASHMTSLGIPRLVVSKILNHVESGVTAVYDRHSYDREKREALNAWGVRIREIIATKVRPALTLAKPSAASAMDEALA